jgi:lipoate-protein ligase B
LEVAQGKRKPTLLLLEHAHVYTFGRKGNAENLLWNETQLKEKGISTFWVDRGGDVTYHGPGQLVGYPLIPLGKLNNENKISDVDYVRYIRNLEKMLIGVLMQYGIASGQIKGKTGVWVQADVHSKCPRCKPEDKQKPAKIAAIGVKVDAKGITRHGFALNVNPDMDYWDGIIPCGLPEPVVSLADLLPEPPTMQDVKDKIKEAFYKTFQNQS